MAECRENLFSRFIVGNEIGELKAEEIVHALLPQCGIHLTAVLPKPRQVFELVFSDEMVAYQIENNGFRCKGKTVNVYASVPKGTWIRIRGIPLFWSKDEVVSVFKRYGRITSGPTEILYRDTQVRTGDRSLKIDIINSIPQDVAATVAGESFALTVRYREQPKACFTCGEGGHIKQDCPLNSNRNRSYSNVVAATSTYRHTHTTEQNTTEENAKYTQPQSSPVTTTHTNTPVTTAAINTPVTTPHSTITVTTAPTKPSFKSPQAKQKNTHTAPSTQQSQKSRRSPKQGNKRKQDTSVERADKHQQRQKHRNISGNSNRSTQLSDGECSE